MNRSSHAQHADAPPQLATRLLTWLRDQDAAMVTLLEKLVRAESPSSNPSAQIEVMELLRGELQALGFESRKIKGRKVGDHLFARPVQRSRHLPTQMLLGHLDTVWPVGTIDVMPFHADEHEVRGPGVVDMKGGLVQALFALRALREMDVTPPATPVVWIVSDEEVGSVESKHMTRRLAKRMCRTFVVEPALGKEGKLKTSRKGTGRFYVTVYGKAAHAGLDAKQGASAILELSHQIQALFAMNDDERHVTLNVGKIEGGAAANVIAPLAQAELEVRVPTHQLAAQLEHKIRALQSVTAGTRIEVVGGFGRPPMEFTPRNQVLWSQAQHAAHLLGFAIDHGFAGGASDGNFTSEYCATLDGLGAVGDGLHAAHEHLLRRHMPDRAGLLAMLLASPLDGSAS